MTLPVLFFVLLGLLVCIVAVDRSKFRTCQDTGFCRDFRNHQPTASQFFHVDGASIKRSQGKLTAHVQQGNQSPLNLEVSFLKSGSVRVKVSEKTPRWQPSDLLVETSHVLAGYAEASKDQLPAVWKDKDAASFTALTFQTGADTSSNVLLIQHSPFKVELYRDGVVTVAINDRNLMHYEQTKGSAGADSIIVDEEEEAVDRHQGKEVVDYGEDGLAIYSDGTREEKKAIEAHAVAPQAKGESFGGHFDSMPLGARSVGLDFSFPCAENVYGIPEHTTPLSLPTTTRGSADAQSKYSQPYRLYNLDVFEYELQETMALYGHIPLMWSHGKCKTAAGEEKTFTTGVFWFNPAETFIDVSDGKRAHSDKLFKESHWISESGELDVFLLPGSSPKSLLAQYSSITGTQSLPPLFALGYHQCRWNYRDEADVFAVNGKFEELDYPYDVLWLDIEHTNGKRYFTWDHALFPNPLEMQKNLTALGRKMVTIIDPHIKRDDNFHIHKEATQKGLYIKDKTGKDFDGWCWPGSSSYLDFTDPRVRQWWAEQFSLDKYSQSSLDLYTWNDMNEPSVFNGPEVSMSKDSKNLEGVEHREWHNLYGIYMQMATAQGQVHRCPAKEKKRPFVLTRAFWAGSQRFGAMWTGDNTADWGHLKISVPMLLSINLAGLSFAGADVGGFFGEPNAELFTRWYQAGAFTPFFRGHAHHDTKRREPWVHGEPHTSIHRNTAMLRYSLLPLWYTTFFEAYETGMSVMRAMFTEFPELEESFTIDDQWMVGDSLLVKPVTDSGVSSVNVFLPPVTDTCGNTQRLPWYDLETLQPVHTAGGSNFAQVSAPLNKIPVFIKPGKILSRKMRLRRSASLMYYDPYTLVITPGSCGKAEGLLYLDDESSFAFEESGKFALRKFSFSGTELTSSSARTVFNPVSRTKPLLASPDFSAVNTVERVVLAGQRKAPKKVVLSHGDNAKVELSFTFDEKNGVVTIKKPDVRVIDDWSISLEF